MRVPAPAPALAESVGSLLYSNVLHDGHDVHAVAAARSVLPVASVELPLSACLTLDEKASAGPQEAHETVLSSAPLACLHHPSNSSPHCSHLPLPSSHSPSQPHSRRSSQYLSSLSVHSVLPFDTSIPHSLDTQTTAHPPTLARNNAPDQVTPGPHPPLPLPLLCARLRPSA